MLSLFQTAFAETSFGHDKKLRIATTGGAKPTEIKDIANQPANVWGASGISVVVTDDDDGSRTLQDVAL